MEDFDKVLSCFKSELMNLYLGLSEYLDGEPSMEDAAKYLVEMTDLKTNLSLIYEDMSSYAIQKMRTGEQVEVDGRMVEKMIGSPRKTWQHDQLKQTVLNRILSLSLDETTGEITLTPREAVDKVLEFAHVDYWRVGELKKLDINADLYCEVGDAKTTLKIGKPLK